MYLLKNNFVRIALGTALFLLIPLTLQLTIGTGVDGQGFNWRPGDFVFAFVLIFSVGSLFEIARRRAGGNNAYKIAAALALAGCFLLVWVNGAVGIIGSEDTPANLLYGVVLASGFLGSILARLKPLGMSRTLFVMATVQMLVPVAAFIIWRPVLDEALGFIGVLMINAFFATLFIGSAILFRQAAEKNS